MLRKLLLISLLFVSTSYSLTLSVKVKNLKYIPELKKYGKVKSVLPQIKRVFIEVEAEDVDFIRSLPFVQEANPTTKGTFPGSFSTPSSLDAWHIKRIGVDSLWARGIKGRGVVIALIDTGVDYNNPDLSSNILVSEGYDFGDGDEDPMDEHGHGTVMASIICSRGDVVKGIAPGTKILPLKIAPDGKGTFESDALAEAIIYAADKGVDVINMSLLGDYSPEVAEAVEYALGKGVVLVAASGNENESSNGFPSNLPGVISVSSVGRKGIPSSFTNFGFSTSLSAPGESILGYSVGNVVVYVDGTSASSAIVSASIALLLSAGMSKDELPYYLIKGSEDLGWPGYDQDFGFGLVRPDRALEEKEEGDACIMPDILYVAPGEKKKVFFSDYLEKVEAVNGSSHFNVRENWPYVEVEGISSGDGAILIETDKGRELVSIHVSQGPSIDVEGCSQGFYLSLQGVSGSMADMIFIQFSYFENGLWGRVGRRYLVYPGRLTDEPIPFNYPFGHLIFDEDIDKILLFQKEDLFLLFPGSIVEFSFAMVMEDHIYISRDVLLESAF